MNTLIILQYSSSRTPFLSLPPDPTQKAKYVNSYTWCWWFFRVYKLIQSGSHARRSSWHSYANHPWRSKGNWAWSWEVDHIDFKMHWGAWTQWNLHQGVEGQEATKTRQRIKRILAVMKKFCRSARCICLLPDCSAWIPRVTCIVRHCR